MRDAAPKITLLMTWNWFKIQVSTPVWSNFQTVLTIVNHREKLWAWIQKLPAASKPSITTLSIRFGLPIALLWTLTTLLSKQRTGTKALKCGQPIFHTLLSQIPTSIPRLTLILMFQMITCSRIWHSQWTGEKIESGTMGNFAMLPTQWLITLSRPTLTTQPLTIGKSAITTALRTDRRQKELAAVSCSKTDRMRMVIGWSQSSTVAYTLPIKSRSNPNNSKVDSTSTLPLRWETASWTKLRTPRPSFRTLSTTGSKPALPG